MGLVGRKPPEECLGDVNGDGVVDRKDFKLLTDNWYSDEPIVYEGGRSINLDLNGDGIVDILDIRVVTDNFGCNTR